MAEIKFSVSDDMKKVIKNRAEELGFTGAEYVRTLVNLDLATQKYQKLSYYTNKMATTIMEYHSELGIYATPLQGPTILDLNEI